MIYYQSLFLRKKIRLKKSRKYYTTKILSYMCMIPLHCASSVGVRSALHGVAWCMSFPQHAGPPVPPSASGEPQDATTPCHSSEVGKTTKTKKILHV